MKRKSAGEDSEDEDFPDPRDEEDEYEEYDEELDDGEFQDVVTAEERQKIELQFERTLEEYGDEEIGELEDVSARPAVSCCQWSLTYLVIICARRTTKETSLWTATTRCSRA